MKRRIVTFILAFALLLSLSITAFAATVALPEGSDPRFTGRIDKETLKPGDTFRYTVTGHITTPIAEYVAYVKYSSSILEIVSYGVESDESCFDILNSMSGGRDALVFMWSSPTIDQPGLAGRQQILDDVFYIDFKVKEDVTGSISDSIGIRSLTYQWPGADANSYNDDEILYTISATEGGGEESPTCSISSLAIIPVEEYLYTGDLFSLNLGAYFSDSDGHSLTFTLVEPETTDYVKISGGTFYFTAQQAGDYHIVIDAACLNGGKYRYELDLHVTVYDQGLDIQYGYDETSADQVTVYFTLTNNGAPIIAADGTVLAHKEVTVPYFDLGLYGLQEYYRYHTKDGRGEYVDRVIVERPTALHLYIYMLERYYMGLPEEECCKGTSGVLEYAEPQDFELFNSSNHFSANNKALEITGSATHLYMEQFWGHDQNLMYFRNHVYPYQSPGWGATCDFMVLRDNDAIDVAMHSDWSFYTYFKFVKFDQEVYTVEAGEKLNCSTWSYATTYQAADFTKEMNVVPLLYDENWEEVMIEDYEQNINEFSYSVPETPGTYYLLACDRNGCGKYGTSYAPATAKVIVTPKQTDEPAIMYGDVNGDGEIDITDVQMICRYILGTQTLSDAQFSAAEVNNDGELDITDLQMIIRRILGTQGAFPVEKI